MGDNDWKEKGELKKKVVMGMVLSLLFIGMLTLSFNIQPVKADQVFSDDFDDGDISDWTVTTTGDAIFEVSTSKYVSSPYSVHMKSLGNYRAISVSPSYDLNLSEDYDISFYFLIPHTDNHWFEVFNNRQTYLVIDSGSDLKCYLGNLTSLLIMTLVTNQWYHIEIKAHPSSNNYDVHVNSTFKKTCPMWIHGTYNQSFRIGDRADGSTDRGEAYWDDVYIHQYTTPVGGIYIQVNKLSLLAPYIGLTILLAVAVVAVGYIKKKKETHRD